MPFMLGGGSHPTLSCVIVTPRMRKFWGASDTSGKDESSMKWVSFEFTLLTIAVILVLLKGTDYRISNNLVFLGKDIIYIIAPCNAIFTFDYIVIHIHFKKIKNNYLKMGKKDTKQLTILFCGNSHLFTKSTLITVSDSPDLEFIGCVWGKVGNLTLTLGPIVEAFATCVCISDGKLSINLVMVFIKFFFFFCKWSKNF